MLGARRSAPQTGPFFPSPFFSFPLLLDDHAMWFHRFPGGWDDWLIYGHLGLPPPFSSGCQGCFGGRECVGKGDGRLVETDFPPPPPPPPPFFLLRVSRRHFRRIFPLWRSNHRLLKKRTCYWISGRFPSLLSLFPPSRLAGVPGGDVTETLEKLWGRRTRPLFPPPPFPPLSRSTPTLPPGVGKVLNGGQVCGNRSGRPGKAPGSGSTAISGGIPPPPPPPFLPSASAGSAGWTLQAQPSRLGSRGLLRCFGSTPSRSPRPVGVSTGTAGPSASRNRPFFPPPLPFLFTIVKDAISWLKEGRVAVQDWVGHGGRDCIGHPGNGGLLPFFSSLAVHRGEGDRYLVIRAGDCCAKGN